MDLVGCFIKFGEYHHLIDLQKNGLLYCNPINYFTEIEDNNLRGDVLETVVDIIYMDDGEIMLGKPNEIPITNGLIMPFKDARIIKEITEPFGNLFCLYKINIIDKPIGEFFSIDLKVVEFGEYFLLIHDAQTFLKKVKEVLNELKILFYGDLVKYLDLSKYTGKKSIFQKDIKYEYQQEYRIFIKNNKLTPIIIEIGNLENISIICQSKNVEKLIIAGSKKNESTYTIYSNLKKP